jgi:hypothetical protein
MPQSLAFPAAVPMAPAGDELFEDLEPPDGAQAVVIGHHRLDVLCALIRKGCAGVTELRPHGQGGPRPEPAQIAILVDPASLGEAASLIALAWRALDGGGRLVVQDPGGRRYQIEGLLRAHGFIAIFSRETARGTLLLGRRPFALAHG